MPDEAILSSDKRFTSFSFNGRTIKFETSPRLERYTEVVEWDHGYIIVMAKPENASVIDMNGEVLETSMDDIELDIISDYYTKNRKYMEAQNA